MPSILANPCPIGTPPRCICGRPPAFNRNACKQRSTVKRCINRLRQWRGLSTRYDKTAVIYLAAIRLAGISSDLHVGSKPPLAQNDRVLPSRLLWCGPRPIPRLNGQEPVTEIVRGPGFYEPTDEDDCTVFSSWGWTASRGLAV
ncbi:hypothetical protein ACFY8P_32645 [Streptomyces sp. NPDC012693]|uniref:hypothetical protein n=1 Tax=Streptomyces sp. NPDC012693 TaxID=3364844 RepID=UPI00367A9E02